MKAKNSIIWIMIIIIALLAVMRQRIVSNYLNQLNNEILGFPGSVFSYNNLTSKPLKNCFLSSDYGYRIDPINGEWSFHYGIDLMAVLGTPVMNVKDGTVQVMDYIENGYGNYIKIKHLDNTSTLYAHLKEFGNISIGEKIGAGSVIGAVGSTGRSTGPHLHFELISENNESINPKALI